MRTRAQIVERARIHVGHRETGPNDSPLIRAWLRRCGITSPAAWCAAFASWCLEHQDVLVGPGEDIREVARAGALKLGLAFLETLEPQPGDLMFFATDDKGHGHVGIVVRAELPYVLCIEGNSANRVRYVWRLREQVRFASTRPDELWEGEHPDPPKQGAPIVEVSYEGTR